MEATAAAAREVPLAAESVVVGVRLAELQLVAVVQVRAFAEVAFAADTASGPASAFRDNLACPAASVVDTASGPAFEDTACLAASVVDMASGPASAFRDNLAFAFPAFPEAFRGSQASPFPLRVPADWRERLRLRLMVSQPFRLWP